MESVLTLALLHPTLLCAFAPLREIFNRALNDISAGGDWDNVRILANPTTTWLKSYVKHQCLLAAISVPALFAQTTQPICGATILATQGRLEACTTSYFLATSKST
ncbi:MAG: hypothetical protein JXM70_30645 [Pirellulales bacterium]|nr:hypothetical protein [Pirellulales bacterium]